MHWNFFRHVVSRTLLVLLVVAGTAPLALGAEWKAGAAKVKITPERPMWMSGYASRDQPADGTLIDLWAKALVIEDPRGQRAALVSLDLVGIDRDFSNAVRSGIEARHGLAPRQVSLCSSHTHTGPVVGRTLMAMYFLDDVQRQLVADYTADLEGKLVDLVGQAVANLGPARLAWGNGHSTIAVNRRNNREPDVPSLRAAGTLKGPVDYEVPVLSVRRLEGELTAIVFGYACHATVLPFNQWSGDYPGFAQIELEKAHPGATALFFAGCGADQNPLPRRSVDIAREYGRSLAQSVEAVIAGVMAPVEGDLETRLVEIPLGLAELPSQADLEQQSQSSDRYVAQRAKMLLAQLERGESLSPTYPYPVQLWRVGSNLHWFHLGGEVVVDYSLRLKKEHGLGETWVAGYANDVMAYIPSLRVLKEGGYEGGGSMVYYGLPTVWGQAVEEDIVQAAQRLAAGETGR